MSALSQHDRIIEQKHDIEFLQLKVQRQQAEIERLHAVLDGIVNQSTDHQDAIARAKWRATEAK